MNICLGGMKKQKARNETPPKLMKKQREGMKKAEGGNEKAQGRNEIQGNEKAEGRN
jgi:hypothetical protein